MSLTHIDFKDRLLLQMFVVLISRNNNPSCVQNPIICYRCSYNLLSNCIFRGKKGKGVFYALWGKRKPDPDVRRVSVCSSMHSTKDFLGGGEEQILRSTTTTTVFLFSSPSKSIKQLQLLIVQIP